MEAVQVGSELGEPGAPNTALTHAGLRWLKGQDAAGT